MSNYTKATNFTAKDGLPSGDSGKIVKGTEIDIEFTAIASAISSKADINSPSFTGTPTAPTASALTNTTQIATTAYVRTEITTLIPTGVITLWSGSIVSIPSGWLLCNGSSGTPDLRDRFVVGAGTTYAVGATGGSASVTLDATMIPAHTHSLSASGTTSAVSNDHNHTFSGTSSGQSVSHSHAVSDPGHFHSSDSNGAPNGIGAGAAFTNGYPNFPGKDTNTKTTGISLGNNSVDHNHTYSGTTSGSSANHTHTVTVSGTSGSTGGGLSHENRPPYLALAYIMKS